MNRSSEGKKVSVENYMSENSFPVIIHDCLKQVDVKSTQRYKIIKVIFFVNETIKVRSR